MGILKDIIARAKERKNRLGQYQDEDRIVNEVNERKKSHWEREAIKDMEEERQKLLKEAVMWENKRRECEEKLKARKMMKFNPEFFQNDEILKQKNMFLHGGNW